MLLIMQKKTRFKLEVNDILCMHMNSTDKIKCKVAASTFNLQKINYTA